MTVDDQVRERIKDWLITSGVSQTELGKALGRRQNWVSRYLSGGIGIDFETAARIAAVFKHPITALFDTPADPQLAKIVGYWRGFPPALRLAVISILEQFHQRLERKPKR